MTPAISRAEHPKAARQLTGRGSRYELSASIMTGLGTLKPVEVATTARIYKGNAFRTFIIKVPAFVVATLAWSFINGQPAYFWGISVLLVAHLLERSLVFN